MLMQIVILVLLAGIAVYAYRAWTKSNAGSEANTRAGPNRDSIEHVGHSAVIQLPPHGDDMEHMDVQVTARHLYREDGFEWHELECDSGHGTVWVDVERDDELEVSVTLERLRLDQLGVDAGQIAELRRGSEIEHADRRFRLTDKGEATFFANADTSKPEPFHYWDLEGDDARHDLGIERWGDEFRVYTTERLDPNRIKVFSPGDTK